MAHADASVRAASMVMSAALLGAALVAAMTMRFTMMRPEAPLDIGVVEIIRPEPEPPPQVETPPRELPPPMDEPFVIEQTPTLFDAEATPAQTELPTIFTPPSPPLVSDPHWTRRPRDLSRYYPARARNLGMEGQVVLDCLVSTAGALDCAVAQETPAGWGFAEAAQRIAREHRMVPALREGQPIEARYRMRVPFEVN